jgi:hypothetical protein
MNILGFILRYGLKPDDKIQAELAKINFDQQKQHVIPDEKAGVCCLCEWTSRKHQGYRSHCYWVNLCLLFVTEGSVNDGTFSMWFLKLSRFMNGMSMLVFILQYSLKPDDKSQVEVFLPIPLVSLDICSTC